MIEGNNIIEKVNNTRKIIMINDGEDSSLLEYCTSRKVLLESKVTGWSVDEILQDLIWESWGEDC